MTGAIWNTVNGELSAVGSTGYYIDQRYPELSTRMESALRGANDLSSQFERARGEGLHIL